MSSTGIAKSICTLLVLVLGLTTLLPLPVAARDMTCNAAPHGVAWEESTHQAANADGFSKVEFLTSLAKSRIFIGLTCDDTCRCSLPCTFGCMDVTGHRSTCGRAGQDCNC